MSIPHEFVALGRGLGERATGRFERGVAVLRAGIDAGSIRKVDLDDAKRALGAAFEKAWECEVAEPFFHAGRFETQPEAIRKLYWDMSANSLHSAIAMQKKLDRSGIEGPVATAMRRVLDEALPLAEAAVELKAHVIKGRAPNPNPTPPKEHKNGTGTCSCCFSGIAITDHGKMAHHGYKRPGWGSQTSSCAGIRFPPLEISTEGLEWLVQVTGERIEQTVRAIEALPGREEIRWTAQTRRGPEQRVTRRGDTDWDRVARALGEDLARQQEMMIREAAFLDGELAKWRDALAIEALRDGRDVLAIAKPGTATEWHAPEGPLVTLDEGIDGQVAEQARMSVARDTAMLLQPDKVESRQHRIGRKTGAIVHDYQAETMAAIKRSPKLNGDEFKARMGAGLGKIRAHAGLGKLAPDYDANCDAPRVFGVKDGEPLKERPNDREHTLREQEDDPSPS